MVIKSIEEWMKATYVSSMEYCGEEISPTINPFTNFIINQKCNEWLFLRKPRLYCMDGFNMSLQGGYGMYSRPEYNADYYYEMEIGFPSQDITECSFNDVGGYVNIEKLQMIITEHGGIDSKKSFKDFNYSGTKKYRLDLKLERILKK